MHFYDTFNRLVRRQDRSDANTVVDNDFAGYDGLPSGQAGINPTLGQKLKDMHLMLSLMLSWILV